MKQHSYNVDLTPSKTTTGNGGGFSNINYMQVGAQQGWQCPICKRVLAPFVPECPCGGQGMQTWTTTGTADIKNETITMNYPEDFNKTEHNCYCSKHMKED